MLTFYLNVVGQMNYQQLTELKYPLHTISHSYLGITVKSEIVDSCSIN